MQESPHLSTVLIVLNHAMVGKHSTYFICHNKSRLLISVIDYTNTLLVRELFQILRKSYFSHCICCSVLWIRGNAGNTVRLTQMNTVLSLCVCLSLCDVIGFIQECLGSRGAKSHLYSSCHAYHVNCGVKTHRCIMGKSSLEGVNIWAGCSCHAYCKGKGGWRRIRWGPEVVSCHKLSGNPAIPQLWQIFKLAVVIDCKRKRE